MLAKLPRLTVKDDCHRILKAALRAFIVDKIYEFFTLLFKAAPGEARNLIYYVVCVQKEM